MANAPRPRISKLRRWILRTFFGVDGRDMVNSEEQLWAIFEMGKIAGRATGPQIIHKGCCPHHAYEVPLFPDPTSHSRFICPECELRATSPQRTVQVQTTDPIAQIREAITQPRGMVQLWRGNGDGDTARVKRVLLERIFDKEEQL